MDLNKLKNAIVAKKSFLCVGLDPEVSKIPAFLSTEYDPIFEFNKRIINATIGHTIAYKLNLAFYEARGVEGLRTLERTLALLPDDVLKIADAKRCDIKATSELYAKAYFEKFNFDAITVNPYMGFDSISPYLSRFEKWAFILTKTSNEGAEDFQMYSNADGKPLYQYIIEKALSWKTKGILGFVLGATQEEALKYIRDTAPNNVLLIPGVGTQGGDLDTVCKYGISKDGNYSLIVNVSRKIMYAGSEGDFEEKANIYSLGLVEVMRKYL